MSEFSELSHPSAGLEEFCSKLEGPVENLGTNVVIL